MRFSNKSADLFGLLTRVSPRTYYDGSERQRLGNEAVDTEIAGLKVQRADGTLTKRLSQVLFRVDVLQHAFSSC